MDDKKLKDMWASSEISEDSMNYGSDSIQNFISKRSDSVAVKISNMIKLDIGFKIIIALGLILNSILFYRIQPMVSYICFFSLPVLLPLLFFEFRVLEDFNWLTDYGISTKEKLVDMLSFLQIRFFTTLLSFASTYLFGFTAGMLLYFYFAYGFVRRLGNMDIWVFSTICLIGIVMNFVTNNSMVNYQKKHLELCLSDLNENSLELVAQNIESRQKLDHVTKILVVIALMIGLLIFIAILKSLGI